MNNIIKIKDAIIKDNTIYDSETKEIIGQIGDNKVLYSLDWLSRNGISWQYKGDL